MIVEAGEKSPRLSSDRPGTTFMHFKARLLRNLSLTRKGTARLLAALECWLDEGVGERPLPLSWLSGSGRFRGFRVVVLPNVTILRSRGDDTANFITLALTHTWGGVISSPTPFSCAGFTSLPTTPARGDVTAPFLFRSPCTVTEFAAFPISPAGGDFAVPPLPPIPLSLKGTGVTPLTTAPSCNAMGTPRFVSNPL